MGALGIGVELAASRARGGFDFGGGVLPGGASLARSTAGFRLAASGSLEPCAVDVARFDHDPASGARLGLLIEPAATNLLTQSNAFGLWTGDTGGSDAQLPAVTPGAAVAPDGGAAAEIAFVRGEGFSRLTLGSETVASGAAAVFSVWLKAAVAGPSIALRCESVDSGTLMLTPQWRRYALGVTGTGGPVACQLLLWSSLDESPANAVVQAWGAQLELGSSPTSPIATSGAVAMRDADVLTLNWGSRGVADGVRTLRYSRGDGAAFDAPATIVGGQAVVPGPAGGMRLVRVEAP